ncbi:hypothetical protein N0V88_000450 [Collariella sp. IMI 366227]|nr:hypothetical protein N0V88_000450 [Collariella sp. IMI 366227]
MAPRREILDSDDDGSVFGDGPEFGTIETHEQAEQGPRDEPQDTLHDSHNIGTDSTDPSFFQRIYNEQQAAADWQDALPDTVPQGLPASAWTEILSAPPPGQKPQAKDYSSLTSITDPVPASPKAKKARDVRQSDVIDLTDITTPRKEAASGTSDVWDVPITTKSQKTTRTFGKRKSTDQQLSLEQDAVQNLPPTQDPYSFPESTPPVRKKAKRGTPSSLVQNPEESSPIMLVPTGEPLSSERRPRNKRKPPASTRRTKKRKIIQEEEEYSEPAPLDNHEVHVETPQQDLYIMEEPLDFVPQPELDVVEEAAPAAPEPEFEPINIEAQESPVPPPKTAAKGKRGRNKKATKADEAPPEPIQPEQSEQLAEAIPEPPRRKRGRLRKSEIAQPPPEPEPLEQPRAEAEDETDNRIEPEPLTELAHNTRPTSPPSKGKAGSDEGGNSKENDLPPVEKPVTKEVKAKEKEQKAAKGGVMGHNGKVQYRVGLSRMSRIAPLLKSLKKPA